MGGMEAICGALIGATICKDLKGKDTGVAYGIRK